MKLDSQSKKPYSPPTVTKLDRQQAKQLVVDRASHGDERAAEFFLELLRQERQQSGQMTSVPPNKT